MCSYRFMKQALLGMLFLIASSAAFAQATRTWISGVGDDANPCSRTAPCKTFAGAISKTASGGIIDVLDPGGFGGVTITKPITLEAVGTIGGILVSGTNGIVVNTPGATDTVVLRGLSIDGIGTGLAGVKVLAVGKLLIEHCTIQNFTADGVDFEPSTSNAQLLVSDSTLNNNVSGSNFSAGIYIQATGATASIDRTRLAQNNVGLFVRNGAASVRQSSLSGNTLNNIRADSTGTVQVNVDNSLISDSAAGTGIFAHVSTASVSISNSTITANNVGLAALSSASIVSYGNNRIFANTTSNGAPTSTIGQQ